MKSPGIWNVSSSTRDMLLGLCLSPAEQEEFARDCEGGCSCRAGSKESWVRRQLQIASSSRTRVACQITDLLDLRYVDLTQFVRNIEPEEVKEEIERAIVRGIDADLPAFLWALSTDPRPLVRCLGHTLVTEALTCAYGVLREVVDFASYGSPPLRSSIGSS
jgi:hypothetical protein